MTKKRNGKKCDLYVVVETVLDDGVYSSHVVQDDNGDTVMFGSRSATKLLESEWNFYSKLKGASSTSKNRVDVDFESDIGDRMSMRVSWNIVKVGEV